MTRTQVHLPKGPQILWNHSSSWGPMFVGKQIFAGSWAGYFVGKLYDVNKEDSCYKCTWFTYTQRKELSFLYFIELSFL